MFLLKIGQLGRERTETTVQEVRDGYQSTRGKEHNERKKRLASILADVATMGAERMSEKIGKASLRDAAIGTGIAVDKMLALTGQTPAVQIANIVMPSGEERAKIDASHRALDAEFQYCLRTWLSRQPRRMGPPYGSSREALNAYCPGVGRARGVGRGGGVDLGRGIGVGLAVAVGVGVTIGFCLIRQSSASPIVSFH